MKIIVTGGLGYIGSCVSRALLEAGHEVGIIDDLRTSVIPASALAEAEVTVASIESITAHGFINRFSPDVVMHLAASTSVEESERKPLEYLQNNVGAFARFLEAVLASGCRRIVHAGSCAVYGAPKVAPVDELHPTEPLSWYGWTKSVVEKCLELEARKGHLRCAALRYFNVIGPSLGIPSDGPLLPRAISAAWNGTELVVYGHKYHTKDGTCVRDYVDVRDVAAAHLASVNWLYDGRGGALEFINIGSGRGLSVLEVLAKVETASSKRIRVVFGPSRDGDIPHVFSENSKALAVLGWKPTQSIDMSVKDAWNAYKRTKGTE